MMHNTLVTEKKKKPASIIFTLLQTCCALWASGMPDASIVMTGPWFPGHNRTPTTRHVITVFKISGSLLAHYSMFCATQGGVVAAMAKAAWAQFCHYSLHSQILKIMFVELLLIPTSSAISQMVLSMSALCQ
jgi:hypothetical protein